MLYFYTEGLGLDPTSAGAILLVARGVDAITDPLMGWIADRTQTRMGRFRPFILAGAIPMAVVGVLTFTNPGLPPDLTLIYAYATYILYGITYTIISIPYSGLTAALTHNPRERTELSAYRMGFAFAGSLAIQMGMAEIITSFDKEPIGFQIAMIVFGVLGVACLWACVFTTRELPHRGETIPARLSDSWAAMKNNLPLWAAIAAFLAAFLGTTIRGGAIAYYFDFVIGKPDLMPVFFGAVGVAMLGGIAVTPLVAARLGKRDTYIVGSVLGAGGAIALYFVSPDNIPMLFACAMISLFFSALPTVMGWAVLPDTIEYGEWQSGIRAEGSIYAITSFSHKLAMAAGGGVAGVLLGQSGFVEKSISQPDSALHMITLMLTLIPAAFGFLGVVAIWFYRLDDTRFAQIESELATRRSATADTI